MAGIFILFPLGVVFADKLYQVFFGFNMGNTGKVINLTAADLALIFHGDYYLKQSSRQQQSN